MTKTTKDVDLTIWPTLKNFYGTDVTCFSINTKEGVRKSTHEKGRQCEPKCCPRTLWNEPSDILEEAILLC